MIFKLTKRDLIDHIIRNEVIILKKLSSLSSIEYQESYKSGSIRY
jgi:hypothetical protein